MALNFNPYEVKLAVSTGSKGRGRFEAGRIRVLKNEWKAMGLRLVPPKDAEYIILPDGSNDKGQGGRYATAIHYSDFIELLSRSQRPLVGSSPTSRLVVRSRTTEAPDDTPEHRILRHNVTQLERRLKALSDRPTQRGTYRALPARPPPPDDDDADVTAEPLAAPAADPVLERVATTDPEVLGYTFVEPTVDFAVVRQAVTKLQSVKNLQAFITAAIERTAPVYATLYTTKQKSLEELRRLTLVVLTYWQELRVNLEVLMADALSPRLDINALPLCDVPAALRLPYDLTSCWTHFFQVWSADNALLFTREDLVGGLADLSRAAEYFWTLETNLYLNFASIQCAQRNLELQFIEWVQTTRERFRTTPRCQPDAAGQCPGQFCVFYDERCQEKPVLFVLQELVIAFCGSTDLLPITPDDYATVNRLHQVISDLYRRWYQHPHRAKAAQVGVCEDILVMVNIMMATLQEEMQVDSVQDLLWSDVARLMHPETLLRDWNDPATTAALRDVVFSEAYVQRVRQVGEGLLRL